MWPLLEPWKADLPLEWAVIGAASRGKRYYQPRPEWVRELLQVLDTHQVPVFFKGNLTWEPRREEFPALQKEPEQLRLF